MSEKEIKNMVDLLTPYILNKMKDEYTFKNIVKATTGSIVSADNVNKTCVVKRPFDDIELTVPIQTYEELTTGDEVILLYWESFSNLVVFKKKE